MIKKFICFLWGHKRSMQIIEYVPIYNTSYPRWNLKKLYDCPRCGAELSSKAKENGDE